MKDDVHEKKKKAWHIIFTKVCKAFYYKNVDDLTHLEITLRHSKAIDDDVFTEIIQSIRHIAYNIIEKTPDDVNMSISVHMKKLSEAFITVYPEMNEYIFVKK